MKRLLLYASVVALLAFLALAERPTATASPVGWHANVTLDHQDGNDGTPFKYIGWSKYDGHQWIADRIQPYYVPNLFRWQTIAERVWVFSDEQQFAYPTWRVGYHTRWFANPTWSTIWGCQVPNSVQFSQSPDGDPNKLVMDIIWEQTGSQLGFVDIFFTFDGGHHYWTDTTFPGWEGYQAFVGRKVGIGGAFYPYSYLRGFWVSADMLRNYSFEDNPPSAYPYNLYWGDWALYQGGAYHGNWWLEYSPGQNPWTSVYQDVNYVVNPGETYAAEVRLRCPSNNPGYCPARLAMWALGGGNPNEVRQLEISVPNDGVWRFYGLYTWSPNNPFLYWHDWLRFEVYHLQTGYNLDMDYAFLW